LTPMGDCKVELVAFPSPLCTITILALSNGLRHTLSHPLDTLNYRIII
jgi:hypothetical protein